MNGNRCPARRPNNRDIINILLTSSPRSRNVSYGSSFFSPKTYGPRASRVGPQIEGEEECIRGVKRPENMKVEKGVDLFLLTV